MSDKNEDKVVILKDEEKIVLDHEYDGIRELDNPLPKWWVYSFYLTIIFAVPYYVAHTFMGAKTIHEEFADQVAIVTEKQDAYEDKQGKFNLEEYNAVASNKKLMKAGRKTYKRKCRACHGIDGGGSVGPNLTDNFWINGNGSLETNYDVINKGVVDKGMAAWGVKLGKDKVYAVLHYISAFKGTTPQSPKEPQGKEY